MLAMADRNGRVWASIPGLANRARVPLEDAKLAIETFLGPDEYSRTPDNEGRRIEPIDGGWRLLNHEKYRSIRDEETTKEAKRNYINKRRAAEREAKSSTVEPVSNTVEQGRDNAEADTDTEARGGERIVDACPHSAIVDLFHERLPTARQVRAWTPARQQALRARWREDKSRQNLEWWGEFFDYIARSDFLSGRSVARQGAKPFEVSMDWLCKQENFVKVLEGAYEN